MKTIRNTDKIRVLGVTFKDIHEAITYAQEGKPKKGVYVGVISERYPCFDSHDYAYDHRRYWNIIFAKSEVELNSKLAKLNNMVYSINFCKYSEKLAPMAYWGGDSHYQGYCTGVELTDDIERVFTLSSALISLRYRLQLLIGKLKYKIRNID